MTDIADFLLERIEEDEQIARFVAADSPTGETRYTMWATPSSLDPDQLVVAVDYQRVLAECAALTAQRRPTPGRVACVASIAVRSESRYLRRHQD